MTTKLLTVLAAAALLAAPAFAEAELAGDTKTVLEEGLTPPDGTVARATFTTAVMDREPVDSIEALGTNQGVVYYFTELQNLAGETLTHRWEWNGQVMAEVSFEVGSPRWRTFSSKNLDPSWLGDWTVSVIDSADRILRTDSFTYTKAAEETAAADTAAGTALPAAIE